MKLSYYFLPAFTLMLIGCRSDPGGGHQHGLGPDGPEPLAYTRYTDDLELYVEFPPLVSGIPADFIVHISEIHDRFVPLREGVVTLSLIVGEKEVRNRIDSAASPGIYLLSLTPVTTGKGSLFFDIKTMNYSARVVIGEITVYPDPETAHESQNHEMSSTEVTFLKDHAWKTEFQSVALTRESFHSVIHTSGQLLPAQGDATIATAPANGIVFFTGNRIAPGVEVGAGSALFNLAGGPLVEGNPEAAFREAQAQYDVARANFQRSSELVTDKIISEKAFLEARLNFDRAEIAYVNIAKNFSLSGQIVKAPVSGFIRNLYVSEGQYVETGAPLASISKNRKLILQANLSQKYYASLPGITSANFRMAGSPAVFNTEDLAGRLISYGRSTELSSPFLPLIFEIENTGNLVAGSLAEIYLISTPIQQALLIPVTALIEEQGLFYVYVQTGGESFEKREVSLGPGDGLRVQVLHGLSEGERVVTKGATQIKLASSTGAVPSHGH